MDTPHCKPVVAGTTTHYYACPHCRQPLDLDRPALEPEQAELAEYRAAVAEWAKRMQWGAESYKREPYNAALFALAAREEARAGK